MDDDSGGCFLVAAIGLMVWGVIWGAVYFYKHHAAEVAEAATTALHVLVIAVLALAGLLIIAAVFWALLGDWVTHQWRRFWLWAELEERKTQERRRVHHTIHLLYLAAREFQHAINEIKKWSD